MQACGVLRGSELGALENVAVFDSVHNTQEIPDDEVALLECLFKDQSAFTREKRFLWTNKRGKARKIFSHARGPTKFLSG